MELTSFALLAAIIGLVNGLLVGGLGLNALIVTLAVGQIVSGFAFRYYATEAIQTPVPPALVAWTSVRFLGVTRIFWIGVVLTVVLILIFRYTTLGRRFQVVGANPTASRIAGLRVNLNQVTTYVIAAIFYAAAGVGLTTWGAVSAANPCDEAEPGCHNVGGLLIGTGIFLMAAGGAGIWWHLWSREEKFVTYEQLSSNDDGGVKVMVGPGSVFGTF